MRLNLINERNNVLNNSLVYLCHFAEINITIPQFNGDGLLSLNRKNRLGHVGEQRVSSEQMRPSFITLNFTTAVPNGFLLWADMVIVMFKLDR